MMKNNNGVNANNVADIEVNNNKEEMNMQNINNNGMSLEEAYSVIEGFKWYPSKYVNNAEDMGISWCLDVDKINDIIYSEFCRDYRDDVMEGAEALKSGMYSERIIEIAEWHGVECKDDDIHLQIKVVDTKEDIIDFLRDEEVRVLRLKSESHVSSTDLLEKISEDYRSPRLLDVLRNMVDEDELFYIVEGLTWAEKEILVYKVINGGLIYYKTSSRFVTIYELGDLAGDIGTMDPMDVDELYVPNLYDLGEAYDSWVVFKMVLDEINKSSKHMFDNYSDLYMDILDHDMYSYIDRYCRGYYGM